MKNALLKLRNVGAATYNDLCLLKINSIEKLAQANPDALFQHLQTITKRRHDPCEWDVFSAILHEAQTGIATPWWHWTKVRKKRQENGTFLV